MLPGFEDRQAIPNKGIRGGWFGGTQELRGCEQALDFETRRLSMGAVADSLHELLGRPGGSL